ncbi:DNA polymerase lambda isoform X2 [Rhipicephalus sanguineus]|uniref:DNA polymerase lambda isoform X2 n=1 Tax=Rhipicephalus sanguineus TaxID=34632 RepID=UPI0020C3759F|nr:DNA polymerase lambda isoform X2 [Rhipicephalus sanguineus]
MFSGTRIFIVPTGIGGPRVKLYKSKVAEHGATVVGDEKLATHIVVAESFDGDRISKILDTENLPISVKIVKCTWLSECLKNSSLIQTTTYELPWKPSPSASTTCSDNNIAPSKRAKLLLEHADCIDQPGVSRVAESSILQKAVASDKWVCAVASTDVPVNKNAHITDQLEAMVETYQSTKDHWRALGYEKAIMQLKRHPTEITTWEEARALPNIGKRLADKIWEIVQQGRLQKLEEFQSQENLVAQNLFTKIWGAGPSTAQKWVQQVKKAALSIQPALEVIPCGSYRRGRAMCGDVDVLITHPDGKSHEGVLCKILQILHENNFLTDDLAVPHDGGSPRKYMGVCKLPEEGSKHRRLDIFVVPQEEFACSLLAFTGSAHFNRSMRLLARRKGMSLNDHGLYADVCRTGEEKIGHGKRLPTPTEESIFEHLGLEYRPPEERDH